MNVSTLLPKDVLLALRPGDISLYLTSRRWISKPYLPAGQAIQFRHPSFHGVDLPLPLTRDLGDYAQRMADLVVALATIEQRPIWEILNDLSGPSGDVFREIERFRGKILNVKRFVRPLLPEVAGWMIIATDVNGTPARVKADLDSDDFALAREALRDDLSVEVRGLIRHDVMAREYVLTEPSEFRVVSD